MLLKYFRVLCLVLLTCINMTDYTRVLDRLLLFSSSSCEYLICVTDTLFEYDLYILNFCGRSTIAERDAAYLVPQLRDLAFSIDIRCYYVFLFFSFVQHELLRLGSCWEVFN